MEPKEIIENIYDFLEYLEKNKGYSAHTIRAYRGDLRHLECASQKWDTKRRRDSGVVDFETDLQEVLRLFLRGLGDLGSKTKTRRMAAVRSFLEWLFEKGRIREDLRFHIPSVKIVEKLPHYLSLDEVITLFREFESEKRRIEKSASNDDQVMAQAMAQKEKSLCRLARDRILFLLLYGGGLRISEACTLNWRQVTLEGHLRIFGKGGKERLVVLPPPVAKAIQTYRRTGHYVFGSRPLSPRTGYEIVRGWGRRAGLMAPLHPHALRHSYATHLLADGANLRIVQELLGHSSLTSTEKYTHLTVDHLAQTMERHHPLGKLGVRDGSKSRISRSGWDPDR